MKYFKGVEILCNYKCISLKKVSGNIDIIIFPIIWSFSELFTWIAKLQNNAKQNSN